MSKSQIVVAMCLILCGPGAVLAQSADGSETMSSTGMLSKSEAQAQATAIINRGDRLVQRIANMLDKARKENDIMKVGCLNSILSQANSSLRNAKSRADRLQGEIDPNQIKHIMTVLSVIDQKLHTLGQEANQCVGQDITETGSSETTTTIDQGIVDMVETETPTSVTTPPSRTFIDVPQIPPVISPTI